MLENVLQHKYIGARERILIERQNIFRVFLLFFKVKLKRIVYYTLTHTVARSVFTYTVIRIRIEHIFS